MLFMAKSRLARGFLHWQYSQVFIGLIFATGVSLALSSKFDFAYVMFCLSGVWSLAFWLHSDFLHSRTQRLKKLRAKKHIDLFRSLSKRLGYWRWSIAVAISITCLISCGYTHSLQIASELDSPIGFLIPANDQLSDGFCSKRETGDPERTQILLGSITSSVKVFPHTVIEFRDHTPILWLTKNSSGDIGVNLDIRERDGRILAQIRDNQFEVNTNRTLHREPRKDFSTLDIRDEFGKNALHFRYMNSSTISISGYIARPSGDAMTIPNPVPYGTCSVDNHVDIVL
jgi:hypothetical protein